MTDALRSNHHGQLNAMPKHRPSVHQTGERPRRTIRLFRNGDRYFVGRHIGVRPEDYSDLGEFLHDLSEAIDLPYGVRRLFTPEQGSEVTDVNILEDGASYVCASFEPFLKLDYTSIAGPHSAFPLEQGKRCFQLERSLGKPAEHGFAFLVSRRVSFSNYLEENQRTDDERKRNL